MEKNSKTKFYLALVIFSLVGQIAWVIENMYFNVFIYEMFNASPADISAMVSASAVSATLTTVIVGALSDKLGRRKVFISLGYILWGISILAFTLVKVDIISALFPTAASVSAICVTATIILDCVMTFFGSSANDACFNAWLTDSTDSTNRGRAEGINSMMPLIAILAVFGGFMGFDLSLESSWTLIFLIIGVAVIAIGVLGMFIIDEPQLCSDENKSFLRNMIYCLRPSVIKENGRLYASLIGFAIFGISIQIFMPYLILYYTVSLKMDNYVLIMAPAIILAAVFTAIWGGIYDKIGFKRSLYPSLALLAAGYVVLALWRSTVPVFIGSLLMMCGYLSGSAVFGAVIRDNTPENRSGMFQGIRILCQVLLPGVIGPQISVWVLHDAEYVTNSDGTRSFVPNEKIFIAALVAIAVLVLYLGVYFLLVKKEKKNG